MRPSCASAVLAALTLTLSPTARGGTVPSTLWEATPPPVSAPGASDWWFRVAPYAWLTAIEGDVAIGPLSSDIDIDFSDTLEDLDMAYMGVVEAGYGRWSLGVDVVYGKTSQDIGGGGRLFRSFRFEQTQWVITPVVAYRLIETTDYRMDVFAGAQATLIDVDLTGRFVGGGETTRGRGTDWVDPIVGVRGQADMSDRCFFRYNGHVGGFGASSDFVWQAAAIFGWRATDSISLGLGYRGLGDDYSEGNFELDTVTHGPVLGFEWRF
jgi:hypothetical protein